MNLVLVTSMIRPVTDRTIYSTKQRLTQTLYTIKSVRDYIPNSKLIMLEGGDLEPNEVKMFKSYVDELHQIDIKSCMKSQGEATLLYRYLISDNFKAMTNIKTISKMSGRYYLTKEFKWNNLPLDKHIISLVAQGWLGLPYYRTRYYRFPYNFAQTFANNLKEYINSDLKLDIEHGFYKLNIIDITKVYIPQKLGVKGYITWSGNEVDE